MFNVVALIACSLVFAATKPQTAKPTPPEEIKQMAFWVGDWKCEGKTRTTPGKDEWQDTKGQNSVHWILDGYVIQENFTMGPFKGMSVSTYNTRAKKWQQTWVDSSGSYIDLAGEFADGKMTLMTLARPQRPGVFNRMVYENIGKDSFDWNWEASTDNGKTWTLNWHLHYTRKK